MLFVHLHCHSPFSFLDGVASLELMVAKAAMYRMPALALTDHNTIAGLPEFHRWAKLYGVKPISGAELTLGDGSHLTVIVENGEGYENLCRLLTKAHDGEGKRRNPWIEPEDLTEHSRGLIVLSGCRQGLITQLLLRSQPSTAETAAKEYKKVFGDGFYIEIQDDAYPRSAALNRALADLAARVNVPLVATGNVHYLNRADFPTHDILTCVRLGIDIHTPHPRRPLNTSQWMFDSLEAQTRFSQYPEAIANTLRIAERCEVVLELHRPLFPAYALPRKETNARDFLRRLVYEGAAQRYNKLDKSLMDRLEHELSIIERLGFVDYFLVVWDIVHYAQRQGIRYAGRGSAADSAVAYCLYITDVDAAGRGLLFERFMSLERGEKPDIDIDFDARRRDEVMAYIYRKYGTEHVARIATYQTFRGKSAIREIGGALSLPDALLDTLAKRVPWSAHADGLDDLFTRVPELKSFTRYRESLTWLSKLSAEIAGFPRHFGMHLGGVVISSRPLLETTSLQPSAKGEWMTPFDKDAVEEVGLVKLDLLSLRTMTAIDGAIHLRERRGETIDYNRIPLDDRETFEMLGTGETIGVFQLESPAQRALQARLHATGLEDIVASVALIRPGPIKGNMVDPFLERRLGLTPITYLHPKLEPIIGKTYGVVLFQEQVIEIATVIANFSPGEADQLRRVMSHARSAEDMQKIGRTFMEKAAQAGVSPEVAGTIFSYIQGYASYGFCEAHAAAFAATAYKTAYLVRHYPAEFYASILNQYPMGYYPVHVICAECRRRGISILGLDINRSEWETIVEEDGIRLGFHLLKGMEESLGEALVLDRQSGGMFKSVLDCLMRVRTMDRLTAERLIRVGAFDSLSLGSRRYLLWHLPNWFSARNLDVSMPLFEAAGLKDEATSSMMDQEDLQAFVVPDNQAGLLADEYELLGVGVSGHWMDLFRPMVNHEGYICASNLASYPDGSVVVVAGMLIRPHRPPTKSGKTVVFFTLEDETGFVDATMFESVYHESGAILFTPFGRLIGVEGVVQRRGGDKPQVVVNRVWPLAKH